MTRSTETEAWIAATNEFRIPEAMVKGGGVIEGWENRYSGSWPSYWAEPKVQLLFMLQSEGKARVGIGGVFGAPLTEFVGASKHKETLILYFACKFAAFWSK